METIIFMLMKYYVNNKYNTYIEWQRIKKNEYVRKWRKLNREKYLEYDRKNLLKYYYYKKEVKELMTIDPTLFL